MRNKSPKYVFVTGGVMSGIGKGVTTASIAKLMQFRGFKVSALKIDPYLNVDPGTLNPVEHGECFVTDQVWTFNPTGSEKSDNELDFTQGTNIAELDQDFGTYERFLDINIHPSHNITSGQIYFETILKERKGDYLGKTVQIIPHCTERIKSRIKQVAIEEDLDVLVVEIGGTVGDMESQVFLESIRQMRLKMPKSDIALVHVTVVPFSRAVGELKSKPTQHSVKTLQSAGLQPDFLVCRSEMKLYDAIRDKISLFSNVSPRHVISNADIDCIYRLPLVLEEQQFGDLLGEKLDLKTRLVESNLYGDWVKTVDFFTQTYETTIKIGMPGKYVDNKDSYVSIAEAISHACAHVGVNEEIVFIDAEKDGFEEEVMGCDGILLTPGFGTRGVEGMIASATIALQNKIPYLGICFGAQLFYVAFMRHIMNLKKAHSTEINSQCTEPVVSMMDEQKRKKSLGGTMRLGGYDIVVKKDTKLYQAYGKDQIRERFRHRYHINDDYCTEEAKKNGMNISAYDETGTIVNAIELDDSIHPWMVGTQFHPEYTSRPNKPSPIYKAFVKAIVEEKNKK